MCPQYAHSSEGYFADLKDPSRGCYGLPPEIEEERLTEWEIDSHSEIEKENSRKVKALGLIRDYTQRDIESKINLLKKLGYESIYIRKKKIKLDDVKERDSPNVVRMYERTISELREIIKNPGKESKLAERLDSLQ